MARVEATPKARTPQAKAVVGILMSAIDGGCRKLWAETVMGDKIETVQDLAIVLHTFIGELQREPRKDGDMPSGVKFTAISMVSRGLCQLLNRATHAAWVDKSLLEALKENVIEEMLASYESNIRTKVLGTKTM